MANRPQKAEYQDRQILIASILYTVRRVSWHVIKKRAIEEAAKAKKEEKKRARLEAKENRLTAANKAEINRGIRLIDA